MRLYRRFALRGFFVSTLALLVIGAASLGAQSRVVAVVAAENFYGDIARQIGGDRVSVTSIMSDPNIDPHEYESSVDDARALASADLVIENGGGYDDWMDKLLSASPRASRQRDHGLRHRAEEAAGQRARLVRRGQRRGDRGRHYPEPFQSAPAERGRVLEERPGVPQVPGAHQGQDRPDRRALVRHARWPYRDDLSLPDRRRWA